MKDNEQALRGKVAIVTGAGRGIGRAIAMVYAQAGAAVCCAARTSTEIVEAVREIEENGGQGLAVPTDVTQLEAVERMFELTVNTFGGLDLLVINAGVNDDRRQVGESARTLAENAGDQFERGLLLRPNRHPLSETTRIG